MGTREIIVMVAEDSRGDLDAVAEALRGKGLAVTSVIPRFRTIVGTGDEASLDAYRSVEGVERARVGETFHKPPPHEDVPA